MSDSKLAQLRDLLYEGLPAGFRWVIGCPEGGGPGVGTYQPGCLPGEVGLDSHPLHVGCVTQAYECFLVVIPDQGFAPWCKQDTELVLAVILNPLYKPRQLLCIVSQFFASVLRLRKWTIVATVKLQLLRGPR